MSSLQLVLMITFLVVGLFYMAYAAVLLALQGSQYHRDHVWLLVFSCVIVAAGALIGIL